jgi:ketosteroid isomerase-like protein
MTKIGGIGGAPSFDPAPEEAAAQAAPAQEVGKVVRGGVRSPEETVRAFYDAFTTKKLDTVESLYAPDAKFKDEIFEYQDRAGTMNMWRSIFAKGPDLKTSYRILGVEGDTVKAHWVADYTIFGRKVHNEIDTTMKVKDGKIVEHRDSFPWDKWAKQALPLGPLGATKPVRELVTHVMRWSIDR